MWMATICVDELLNSYTLWIKSGQLYLMAQWFTMYGCHGLMVYNVWYNRLVIYSVWFNGLMVYNVWIK